MSLPIRVGVGGCGVTAGLVIDHTGVRLEPLGIEYVEIEFWQTAKLPVMSGGISESVLGLTVTFSSTVGRVVQPAILATTFQFPGDDHCTLISVVVLETTQPPPVIDNVAGQMTLIL